MGIVGLLPGLLWVEVEITYCILLAVFISVTLVATLFYFRTKARLRG
ncbi:MAG: hypothetical protein KAW09_10500 [Thermoplasmata archaeon]|nr:hypothetical protein [Thermoplasmata archaeon]